MLHTHSIMERFVNSMPRILGALVFVLVLRTAATVQERGFTRPAEQPQNRLPLDDPKRPPRRMALVIGNWQYGGQSELRNAKHDFEDVGAKLKRSGFLVASAENASHDALDTAIDGFSSSLHQGDVAVVYYAGHGAQVRGHNYLIPADFKGRSSLAVEHSGYDVELLHEKLVDRNTRARILLLDACRNNPFKLEQPGLASMEAPIGTLLVFAASSGHAADENPKGHNGLFTEYLLKDLAPGIDATALARKVQQDVYAASHGRQFPTYSPGLVGNFPIIPSASETAQRGVRRSSPLPILRVARLDDVFPKADVCSQGKADVGIAAQPSARAGVGRFYLSSTLGGEAAQDGPGEHSPFSASLISALESKHERGFGALGLAKEVLDTTTAQRQTPVFGRFGQDDGHGIFCFIPKGASAPTFSPFGKFRALLIAGTHYKNFPNLRNPINDARGIAQVLSSQYGFDVQMLEDPTQTSLVAALNELSARKWAKEDEVFIFFAGHGYYDSQTSKSYLVTADSRLPSDDKHHFSFISLSQLAYALDNLQSEHVFVVIDSSTGPLSERR
jgi:uncharacterized caspase-like protein